MAKAKVASYKVTFDDGSTEWIFVGRDEEPPQPGDAYEGDPRVVARAEFQDESGDPPAEDDA